MTSTLPLACNTLLHPSPTSRPLTLDMGTRCIRLDVAGRALGSRELLKALLLGGTLGTPGAAAAYLVDPECGSSMACRATVRGVRDNMGAPAGPVCLYATVEVMG